MTIFLNFSVLTHENYHAIIHPHSSVKSQDTSQDFQEASVFPESGNEMQKKLKLLRFKPQSHFKALLIFNNRCIINALVLHQP